MEHFARVKIPRYHGPVGRMAKIPARLAPRWRLLLPQVPSKRKKPPFRGGLSNCVAF